MHKNKATYSKILISVISDLVPGSPPKKNEDRKETDTLEFTING